MKEIFDETEIIRSKYFNTLKFSYITNGTNNRIEISTDSKDKTDIDLIYQALKTKLIKVGDKLVMNLQPIDYEDSPNYYVTETVEAVFLSVYNVVKDNLGKLRASKPEGV